MSTMLRDVCMSAVFISLLLSITPEGGAKRAAKLCSAAVLCLILAGGISRLDFETYSLSIAEYDAAAERMKSTAEDTASAMNRLVIEKRCEAYIMDKAAEMELELQKVSVLARWSREGVWVPESASLEAEFSAELSEIISSQLGIARKDQEWKNGKAAGDSE